jgi:hypothetical protein
MTSQIRLTTKHLIPNGLNNSLRFEFANSSVNFRDQEICVERINMYNSVFNIDSLVFSNNTFSLSIPTAATFSTINITLPDGYYNYADITRYLQAQLALAGAYLIDSTGNFVYYIRLQENKTYYACQIDLLPTPTSLPAGWTRPATGLYSAGGPGLPTASNTPRIVINNTEFGKIIGFTNGTYPAAVQTTSQSFLSNQTPQVNPISSYTVLCNLIDNPYTIPSDSFTSFTSQGTDIGELIDYRPNEFSWITIKNGGFPAITLQIVDQNERPVRIRDPNIYISLLIRQKS